MDVSEYLESIKQKNYRLQQIKNEINMLRSSKKSGYVEKIPDSHTVSSKLYDAYKSYDALKGAYYKLQNDPSATRYYESKLSEASMGHEALFTSFKRTREGIDGIRSNGSTADLDRLLYEEQAKQRQKIEDELEFIKKVDPSSLSEEQIDEIRRVMGEDLRTILQVSNGDLRRYEDGRTTAERNADSLHDEKKHSLRSVEQAIESVNYEVRKNKFLSFEGQDHDRLMKEIEKFFKHVSKYSEIDMRLFDAKVMESERYSEYSRAVEIKQADCLKEAEGLAETLGMDKTQSRERPIFLASVFEEISEVGLSDVKSVSRELGNEKGNEGKENDDTKQLSSDVIV